MTRILTMVTDYCLPSKQAIVPHSSSVLPFLFLPPLLVFFPGLFRRFITGALSLDFVG